MTKRKPLKDEKDMDSPDLGFDEAPARSIQTGPDDLLDHGERVAIRVKETRQRVEEKREQIRRGGRREPAKRFRP